MPADDARLVAREQAAMKPLEEIEAALRDPWNNDRVTALRALAAHRLAAERLDRVWPLINGPLEDAQDERQAEVTRCELQWGEGTTQRDINQARDLLDPVVEARAALAALRQQEGADEQEERDHE